jgi:hypothetical protein
MKTEPFIDRDSIRQIFTDAKLNRVAYLRDNSAKAAGAARWGGVAALFAVGLALLFSGPGTEAGAKSGKPHGSHTTSQR